MKASGLQRAKEFEEEGQRLKQMYADLSLENEAMNDLTNRSSEAVRQARWGGLPWRQLWPGGPPQMPLRSARAGGNSVERDVAVWL